LIKKELFFVFAIENGLDLDFIALGIFPTDLVTLVGQLLTELGEIYV
jgi:hypothetical protein